MSITIAEFNSQFAKSVRDHYDNQAKEAIKNSAMARIFNIVDTSEYTESFISTEGISLPNWINESQDLPNSTVGKGHRTVLESNEFGHNIVIPYKERLRARDNTEAILKIVNKYKNGSIIAMHTFMAKTSHNLLNNAFTTTLAPDGLSLINAAHKWSSSSGTFSNLLEATALSLEVVEKAEKIAGEMKDSVGSEMPVNLHKIIVKKGGKSSALAKKIFGINRDQYKPATLGDVDIYMGGTYEIIETPYLTSGDAYFFVGDHEMLGVENPLAVRVVDRPGLKEAWTSAKNLDWVGAVAGSFKTGVVNMPFTIIGSKGA